MAEQQYPEPTVGALIFNAEGKLFLMRSHKWKGRWVVPGGHIELGETMADALRREVKEETNLDIRDLVFVCFQEFIYDERFWKPCHFIFFDYACRTDSSDVRLNSEAQAYRWVTVDEALNMAVEHYTAVAIREHIRRQAQRAGPVETRRIGLSDGDLLRELHLRMYADSPDAFSESLATVQTLTTEKWEARARRLAGPTEAVAFGAWVGSEPIGFIAGFRGRWRDGAMHRDVHDTVTLARAWVDPRHRRHGVGRALVKAVEAWAVEQEAGTLEAQVTETNAPAIRFYVTLGFADTGHREPLLSNPTLQIQFLTRSL